MTSPTNKRAAGFTLMELLVVIAVMGLVLVSLAQYGPPRLQGLQMQAAARQVVMAMQDARGRAIAGGGEVALRLPALPSGISVTQTPAVIRFAPDGSASGGEVVLVGAGRRVEVVADWLTGRAEVK